MLYILAKYLANLCKYFGYSLHNHQFCNHCVFRTANVELCTQTSQTDCSDWNSFTSESDRTGLANHAEPNDQGGNQIKSNKKHTPYIFVIKRRCPYGILKNRINIQKILFAKIFSNFIDK